MQRIHIFFPILELRAPSNWTSVCILSNICAWMCSFFQSVWTIKYVRQLVPLYAFHKFQQVLIIRCYRSMKFHTFVCVIVIWRFVNSRETCNKCHDFQIILYWNNRNYPTTTRSWRWEIGGGGQTKIRRVLYEYFKVLISCHTFIVFSGGTAPCWTKNEYVLYSISKLSTPFWKTIYAFYTVVIGPWN